MPPKRSGPANAGGSRQRAKRPHLQQTPPRRALAAPPGFPPRPQDALFIPEITLRIFELLVSYDYEDDTDDHYTRMLGELARVARTCRRWAHLARRVLWREPHFRAWLNPARLPLRDRPRCQALARAVRRLSLTARADLAAERFAQPQTPAEVAAAAVGDRGADAAIAATLGHVLALAPWAFPALRALELDAALLQPYPALPFLAVAAEGQPPRTASGAPPPPPTTTAHYSVLQIVRRHGANLREVVVRARLLLHRMVDRVVGGLASVTQGEAGRAGEVQDPLTPYLLALLRALSDGAPQLAALQIDVPVYARLLRSLQPVAPAAATPAETAAAAVAAAAAGTGTDDDSGTDAVAPQPPQPPPPQPPTFPALRRLHVRVYHMTVPLLASSTLAAHITHLDLTLLPSLNRSAVAPLAALAGNLRVLHLAFCGDYDLSADDLEALADMHRLTDLRLTPQRNTVGELAHIVAPRLTNARLPPLAANWPQLEMLALLFRPPAFTPAAMRGLGRACPRLRHLAIPRLRCDVRVMAGRPRPGHVFEPPAPDPTEPPEPIFPELRTVHFMTAGRPRRHER